MSDNVPDNEAEQGGQGKEEAARKAVGDAKELKALVKSLSEQDKRIRAQSATVLHEVACMDVSKLVRYSKDLIDALARPEAPTRWEVLGILQEMAGIDPEPLEKAIAPATDALHDAESSVVREAAFRMLAAYGATGAKRAEQVWPLLDEALRAYHGDPEYPGMLAGLVQMVEGHAPIAVRRQAAELVEHDATHPKQLISRRAKQIVKAAEAKRGKSKK